MGARRGAPRWPPPHIHFPTFGNWGRGTFRIRGGRYRWIEGMPKTASSVRDVDLRSPALEALKTQRKQQRAQRLQAEQGGREPAQYVFSGTDGGLPNVNFLPERVWENALANAKLRPRTFYQTRHTFASNALAAGEAPMWVVRMLGHKSAEILFQVYAHYIPNRTRRDGSAFVTRMRWTGGVEEPLAISGSASGIKTAAT